MTEQDLALLRAERAAKVRETAEAFRAACNEAGAVGLTVEAELEQEDARSMASVGPCWRYSLDLAILYVEAEAY